jgi:hypothetical protein
MKKKLTLATQTILPLSGDRLRQVVGGSLTSYFAPNPFPVGPRPPTGTTVMTVTTYFVG